MDKLFVISELKLKDICPARKMMVGQFFLGYNSKTFKKKHNYNDRGGCGK